MKTGLVVKDNILINASYNLEITEQRLMLLAIVNARETGLGIDANSKLQIHARDYAKQFHVTNEAAYKALKNAVNNLFERQFSFKEEDSKGIGLVRSRWVSRIKYIDTSGFLEITFAPDVVPLITRLEKHFTTYALQQISYLTGKYAVRLYELVIAWSEIGKVPKISLDDFRHRLGIEDHEYKAMNHFKSRVLEPSLKQINEHTDIILKYEQHKLGRTITGFSFSFKQKNPHQVRSGSLRDKNTIDMFIGLTEKQITFFAHKLAYDNSFASRYAEVGEEYSDLEARLRKKLADQNFVERISKDLIRLGFK